MRTFYKLRTSQFKVIIHRKTFEGNIVEEDLSQYDKIYFAMRDDIDGSNTIDREVVVEQEESTDEEPEPVNNRVLVSLSFSDLNLPAGYYKYELIGEIGGERVVFYRNDAKIIESIKSFE